MIQEALTIKSLGEKLSAVLFLPEVQARHPAIIVAHGALCYKELYFELCQYLVERGLAALAVDMHGHGASEGERFTVNMHEWRADILATVDALSSHPRIAPDSIAAWGHSSGGTAILEAALVEPRVKALIALDATVRDSMPALQAVVFKVMIAVAQMKRAITGHDWRINLIKLMGDTRVAADPQVERALREDPRLSEAFSNYPLAGAKHCFFVDTLKRVDEINTPTLVIWGEQDQLDPPETGRLLFDALKCKKALQVLPGNGHMGFLDPDKGRVLSLSADWALENLVEKKLGDRVRFQF